MRQSVVGPGAVVETRMKVPDGDAVQKVWAVASGGGTAVAVVEVGNQAATAFAVALVMEAPGAVLSAGQAGLNIGGSQVLAWDRAPAVAAVGTDSVDELLASRGGAEGDGSEPNRKGRDRAALVWPLPHTARMAVSTALSRGTPPPPSDLPDAEALVRGWQAHLDRGARIELPDEGLNRRIEQNRRRWLGRTGRMETAEVAELCELSVRLDHHGYSSDAEVVLDEIAARWTTEAPAERLTAFAVHHDLTRDSRAAARYGEPVAEAVEAAARVGAAVPVDSVARLLLAGGQERAAKDLLGMNLRRAEPPSGGLRAELVDDHDDELLLAPGFRPAWRGGPLAVYGLPTRFGPVSFALRWHGERPALLWERDEQFRDEAITLRVPALDPGWSTDQPTGETLLAACR